ncbi:MAG: efflux RND transporter periplasmic adaptor subunit [Nevskiaceae bacterium]|nr:MAG: efflux RND transporter periplasmic adaptor subunit [Nevskiaceae bacterium]
MKKVLLIAAIVLLSAGAGAWVTHHRMTSDKAMGASVMPPEEDSGHQHILVKMKDAQGKIYYTCSMHPQVHLDHPGNCPICGMPLIEKPETTLTDTGTAPSNAHKPLYWYDPMKPDQHFDKPGKSPFMDMQLVPMYGDNAGGGDIISIDPRTVQNLGIRTATVERHMVTQELRAPGSVAINENRIEVVQTRAAGWIEKLHVRALNDPVRKGQLLAEVYSPDLFAAQQEFVLASRAKDAALTASARQRLLLLGLSDGQLVRLEKTGEAQRRVAYYSPVDGVVTELGVRDGAQVSPGMSLYTLADLSKVWVNAEVSETQAANLAPGGAVDALLAALPGRTFAGQIDYVYPEVNSQTRTVRVRAMLNNKNLLLKPGMFADVVLGKGKAREALMVPSESLIRTGTRSTVIVAEAEGRFHPVEVRLGMQRDGQTEVLKGLEEGQKVVASGQFLIDSEANLRGVFNKLDTAEKPADGLEQESGQ